MIQMKHKGMTYYAKPGGKLVNITLNGEDDIDCFTTSAPIHNKGELEEVVYRRLADYHIWTDLKRELNLREVLIEDSTLRTMEGSIGERECRILSDHPKIYFNERECKVTDHEGNSFTFLITGENAGTLI